MLQVINFKKIPYMTLLTEFKYSWSLISYFVKISPHLTFHLYDPESVIFMLKVLPFQIFLRVVFKSTVTKETLNRSITIVLNHNILCLKMQVVWMSFYGLC